MRPFSVIVLAAFALSSCFGSEGDSSRPQDERENSSATILVMGDSLTAGYQLPPESSYPSQLEVLLREKGYAYSVSNAGVSGDTSAGLLSRTDWLLQDPLPDLAIVCIGANDGLQGLSVSQMEKNVRSILSKLREKNVPTVLVGMSLPRNLGPAYVSEFEAVYPRLAREFDVPLLPFLLE
jgi:acyl-CoA thioesterase-1